MRRVARVLALAVAAALAGCAEPGSPAVESGSGVDGTFDAMDGGPNVHVDAVVTIDLAYDGNTGARECYLIACSTSFVGDGIVTDGADSSNDSYLIKALSGLRDIDVELSWESRDGGPSELNLTVIARVRFDADAYRTVPLMSAQGPSPVHVTAHFDAWNTQEDGDPGLWVQVPRSGAGSEVVFVHSGQPFHVAGTATGVGAAADAASGQGVA